MHIHLDAIGGISGNMFIGALLDINPTLATRLPALLAQAGFANLVSVQADKHHDGVLSGTLVAMHPGAATDSKASMVHDPRRSVGGHSHRSWRDIRHLLQQSQLDAAVKSHAVGIFSCLAEAEAKVHGTTADAVEFHEVGAWDSIADIVCSAWLIAESGVQSWSVSSLPLGRGRIDTAHGVLPVPAPAVTVLLQGFSFHDDGREGERVTPTGAAILKYLAASQTAPQGSRTLAHSGLGFGTRKFAGISNVLRALVFAERVVAEPADQDSVTMLSFEVDDQNPEDLALGLEQVREHPDVIDVLQYPVYGKKQRLGSSVRVLVRSEGEEEVRQLCFVQTTTLGIRHAQCARSVLPRWEDSVELEGRSYRVKLARRPDGQITAKAELDDLAVSNLKHAERQLVREVVEVIAIERHLDIEAGTATAAQEPDALG